MARLDMMLQMRFIVYTLVIDSVVRKPCYTMTHRAPCRIRATHLLNAYYVCGLATLALLLVRLCYVAFVARSFWSCWISRRAWRALVDVT